MVSAHSVVFAQNEGEIRLTYPDTNFKAKFPFSPMAWYFIDEDRTSAYERSNKDVKLSGTLEPFNYVGVAKMIIYHVRGPAIHFYSDRESNNMLLFFWLIEIKYLPATFTCTQDSISW